MAAKTITMLQIRRIIQLAKQGVSKRSIARQCSLAKNTVKDYLKIIEGAGVTLHELSMLDDEKLHLMLFDGVRNSGPGGDRFERLERQFPDLQLELCKTGVTKELLWQEYRIKDPDGYSYSQFCYHLGNYISSKSTTMHLTHKAGEVLQVDFAGKKFTWQDAMGNKHSGEVLIATLPFSGFAYAEVVPDQTQRSFLQALENALFYLGGVPDQILSDNLKSAVKRADRYEPEFTDLMNQFSLHYNTAAMATRVAKPRDKASVEKSVNLAYERIYAPLRHTPFGSLQEVNERVWAQLENHNGRMFRKSSESRRELFDQHEKALLKPLPNSRLELRQSVTAKVQRNYHVVLGQDWHYYSVPYQYVGKQSTIAYTISTVEIYVDHKRVAVHRRTARKNGYTTVKEHMPPNHLHYAETRGYTPDYFLKAAEKISPTCVTLFRQILESRQPYQQAFNSCLGILRLVSKYPPERVSNACLLALQAKSFTYGFVNDVLKNSMDMRTPSPPITLPRDHENLRGEDHFRNL